MGIFAMMKRRDSIEFIAGAAGEVYGPAEARAIAFLIAEKLFGLSRTDIICDPDAIIPDYDHGRVESICAGIRAHRPVQYLLGETEFCGLRLKVSEGVLIPRPETEELVGWMVPELSGADPGAVVLDVGTGSGAIAIALAAQLPGITMDAVDISADALKIARANAELCGVTVNFAQADILATPRELLSALPHAAYNAIVSNPPYIPVSEKTSVRANVAEYEPACALFVEDGDPLLFYREIAAKAKELLRAGGTLWFEIHESFPDEVCALMARTGFGEIECRRDINDKPRMVRCRKI